MSSCINSLPKTTNKNGMSRSYRFLLFSPLLKFIKKINKSSQPIKLTDFPDPSHEQSPTYFRDLILKEYNRQITANPLKKPSYLKIFFKVFRGKFLTSLIFQILFIVSRLLYGLLLRDLLKSVASETDSAEDSLISAAYLISCILLGTIFRYYRTFKAEEFNMILKQCITSIMYLKSCSMSYSTLQNLNPGKIVNIVANDINFLDVALNQVMSLICAPIVLLGTIALLWYFFGLSCIPGMGLLALIVPLQMFITSKSKIWRKMKNSETDDRTKLTRELIESIRQVKMYAWELSFMESVKKIRDNETNFIKKMMTLDCVNRAVAISSTSLSSFAIFLFAYLSEGTLPADKIFPTIFILSFVRVWGIIMALVGYSSLIELRLMYTRIIQLLEHKENKPEVEEPLNSDNAIEFDDYSAGYVRKTPQIKYGRKLSRQISLLSCSLTDINLDIKRSSTIAILGKTGSGKTSLLLSLLKELTTVNGTLRSKGRFAFVEQEPVFYPGTIRENILFGQEFDQEFYDKVSELCCLKDDFNILTQGDQTELSDKASNLSGGQRARLSLARALYSRADIYLLDDPTSAVDYKVAIKIMRNVVHGYLKDKTVLLATHHIQNLDLFDNIIILKGGTVAKFGPFAQVSHLLKEFEQEVKSMNKIEPRSVKLKPKQKIIPTLQTEADDDKELLGDRKSMNMTPFTTVADDEPETNRKVASSLGLPHTKSEIFKTPSMIALNPRKIKVSTSVPLDFKNVSWLTYKEYLKSVFSLRTSLFYFIFIATITEIANIGYSRMIGIWADEKMDPEVAMYICAGIVFGVLIMQLIRHMIWYRAAVEGATKIHHQMIEKIVRSPVAHFDFTPSGEILNRFSGDLGILDKNLNVTFYDSIEGLYQFIGVLVTVWVIQPIVALPGLISCIIYIWILKSVYKPMSISKSFDLITRGPVYTFFISTLSGSVPIRVYGQSENFIEKFMLKMRDNLKCFYHHWYCVRLQNIFVDIGGTIYVIAGILILVLNKSSADDPSIYGLALSYLLSMNNDLSFLFKQLVQTNLMMESTSRVLEYAHLPSEGELEGPRDEELIEEGWPLEGGIKFNDVYLKYRSDLDHVVKGLHVEIKPNESVGIVGRTGAGKSSIVQTLFRTYEIDKDESEDSSITIDGVDISKVGLHCLRGSLSIIPQTPVLLTGSVRKNLDPLGKHSDEELWDALEEVKLKSVVMMLGEKLNHKISNSTPIFSVGQKQLFCLARAILKKSKILVLDEATAFVDQQTDNFIQQKIAENFQRCTILSIAHRLTTIAHYDKILVLDKGRVLEYGHPYELLVKKIGDESITKETEGFARMVNNAGPKTAGDVFSMCKESYFEKNMEI